MLLHLGGAAPPFPAGRGRITERPAPRGRAAAGRGRATAGLSLLTHLSLCPLSAILSPLRARLRRVYSTGMIDLTYKPYLSYFLFICLIFEMFFQIMCFV